MALSPRRYFKDHVLVAQTLEREEKQLEADHASENPWTRFGAWKRGTRLSRTHGQWLALQANLHICQVVMDGHPVCSCGLIASKPLLPGDKFEVEIYLYEPGHININREPASFFVVYTGYNNDGGVKSLFCQFCGLLETVIDGSDADKSDQLERVKALHQNCDRSEYFARLGISEARYEELLKEAKFELKKVLKGQTAKQESL